MSYPTKKDGNRIIYKNQRTGKPVVFCERVSDRLPLNSPTNRAQYCRELAMPLSRFNRPLAHAMPRVVDAFQAAATIGSIHAGYECIKALRETEFTDDQRKFGVPARLVHSSDDQLAPIKGCCPQIEQCIRSGMPPKHGARPRKSFSFSIGTTRLAPGDAARSAQP